MLNNYKLDAEDEKIISELDNLCGVIQNKEILKDMILYIKLKSYASSLVAYPEDKRISKFLILLTKKSKSMQHLLQNETLSDKDLFILKIFLKIIGGFQKC